MPKRNQASIKSPKTAGTGAAENEVWLNAPKFLGTALIKWSVSRMPESYHSPNDQELALAHGCAFELCKLSLDAISRINEPRATNSWREMFCFSVGTLAMFGTTETLALIKQLEKRVPPQEVSMKFRTYQALMWFDEERAASIEKMLPLQLPADLLTDRDLHLQAFLQIPLTSSKDSLDRSRIVSRLIESPISYSTKRAERTITRLLKTQVQED